MCVCVCVCVCVIPQCFSLFYDRGNLKYVMCAYKALRKLGGTRLSKIALTLSIYTGTSSETSLCHPLEISGSITFWVGGTGGPGGIFGGGR